MTISLSSSVTRCLFISHAAALALALVSSILVAYFNTLGKINTILHQAAREQAQQIEAYISLLTPLGQQELLSQHLSSALTSAAKTNLFSQKTLSIRVYNSSLNLDVKNTTAAKPHELLQKSWRVDNSADIYEYDQPIDKRNQSNWKIEIKLDKEFIKSELVNDFFKQSLAILALFTVILSFLFYLVRKLLVNSNLEIEIAKHAIENTEEGTAVINSKGEIINYNEAFLELIGISVDTITSKDFDIRSLVQCPEKIREIARKLLRKNQQWSGELEIQRPFSKPFSARVKVSVIRNKVNRVTAFVIRIQDLTKQKMREKELEKLAYKDPLTTLANRTSFELKLKHEAEVCKRLNRKLCLLFIDLDKFKTINDTFGHEAGDKLLKTIAKRFRERLRATDTLARIGGDEFTVILPDLDGNCGFEKLGRELIALAGTAIHIDNREVFIGASIGAAIFPDDTSEIDELLKLADKAMYKAKSKGRNQITFHSNALADKSKENLFTESDLNNAICNNELELYYQPKVVMGTGNIKGYEALLRWRRNDGCIVAPSDFIPIAEERGMIGQLDRWTIHTGIQQLKLWHCRFSPEISLAINISSIQFHDSELPNYLKQEILSAKLDPTKIEIEIKEATLNQDIEKTPTIIQSLKKLGIKITIDNFGTGSSSIGYLSRLPIDCLKIDQSFICNIKEESRNQVIAKTVISLAKSLGIDVVAEGVEKKLQENIIKKLGYKVAQGYFFSRPESAKKVEAELEHLYAAHA